MLAKQSTDDSERRRLYIALAGARDAGLGEEAAKIALDPEIPPQEIQLRLGMLATLRAEHPRLAWNTFNNKAAELLSSFGNMVPLIEAQFVPQFFWNSLPPDEMEAWIKAHVPAEMAPQIRKGMEGARFQYTQKQALVPAADAYLAGRGSHA